MYSLILCDQSDAADHQQSSQDAPMIDCMYRQAEPSVVVQQERHDQSRSDGQTDKRSGPHFLYERQTGIDLDGADQTAQTQYLPLNEIEADVLDQPVQGFQRG